MQKFASPPRWVGLVFCAAALTLGYFAAAGANRFLAIQFSSKELPRAVDWSRETPDLSRFPRANEPLELRLVDEGAVGVLPDAENWGDNYSHNVRSFEDVLLDEPPFVDPTAFARVASEWDVYTDRMRNYGYNGIVLRGFLEYVNFDRVENGFAVYAADSVYRARHSAMRRSFGELFRRSGQRGMPVYLLTDMVALTPPLEAYFQRRFGRMATDSPEFWAVFREGLEEIFTAMPEVAGLVIRIGEAGSIYNASGWDYRSELLVRDPQSLQAMLRELLPVFEKHGRRLIFRTWSVGVGKIGDMHTNPATYERALGALDSPALVVSTKYCMGDFDSYLPLNPTLFGGRHKRIIEFQARREFEGFGAFPNHMGPLYQAALLEFLKKNPNIAGAWVWSQGGGPLRTGPLQLYLQHGFWQLVDLNVFAAAELLKRPGADLRATTASWSARNFGEDPALARELSAELMGSHELVQQGLYIGPFARRQVRALGLEPPPMLWIFKWDIVAGSTSELAAVYFMSRDEIPEALAEGERAAAATAAVRSRVAGLRDRVRPDARATFQKLEDSLTYQEDLFGALGAYRRVFLNYYRWIDTGASDAYAEYARALTEFRARESDHVARYAKNLDFPAYNFFAANVGLTHMERGPAVAWAARILLALYVIALGAGAVGLARPDLRFPGSAAVQAFALGVLAPERARARAAELTPRSALGLVLLTGVLCLATATLFSSAASVWFPVGLGGAALIFLAVYVAFAGNRGARTANVCGLSVLALLCAIVLAALAVRGPVYFWLRFWTSPEFRDVFLTLWAAGFVWMLYAGIRFAPGLYGLSATSLALGCGLLYLAGLLGAPGLETSITALNDEIAVLPLGLSRILGITTHLNIPLKLPLGLGMVGAILSVCGAGLYAVGVRRK